MTIVLAGATGNLGRRIAAALRGRGAEVRALIRRGSSPRNLAALGAAISEVDYTNRRSLESACAGATCVVSALSGLREVIVDAQTTLLEAAIDAGVPRFIPSDYAIDFTKLRPGENRNLDLRREFHARLDRERTRIAATTVFNGAFADLLTGQAPLVLFKLRRVLYWGDADQRMDFTTMDDTAAFTARVALDDRTPRFLRIAGDSPSARDLARIATEVTGKRFRLLRGGSLDRLALLIRIARKVAPQEGEVYPPWQGMQYLHNMFAGRAKLDPLDNDRYPDLTWTTAREVLAAREGRAYFAGSRRSSRNRNVGSKRSRWFA